jgi:hypothetical protein
MTSAQQQVCKPAESVRQVWGKAPHENARHTLAHGTAVGWSYRSVMGATMRPWLPFPAASLTVGLRTCIFCSPQPELHPAHCIFDCVKHGVNTLQRVDLPIRVACSKVSAWVHKQRSQSRHLTDIGLTRHLGAASAEWLYMSCCKHCGTTPGRCFCWMSVHVLLRALCDRLVQSII